MSALFFTPKLSICAFSCANCVRVECHSPDKADGAWHTKFKVERVITSARAWQSHLPQLLVFLKSLKSTAFACGGIVCERLLLVAACGIVVRVVEQTHPPCWDRMCWPVPPSS